MVRYSKEHGGYRTCINGKWIDYDGPTVGGDETIYTEKEDIKEEHHTWESRDVIPTRPEELKRLAEYGSHPEDTVCGTSPIVLKDIYDSLQEKKELLGHSALVLRTNGLELPIDTFEQLIFQLRERNFGPDWVNYIGYVDYLLGGGRGRKRGANRKRRKGRPRKRRNQQLVIGSELGLRNPRPMTMYPATVTDLWRYEVTLASDGSGQVSQFYALRNPLAAANGSGTYPRAPEFAKLYDEYKILSLTVLIDPHTPSISPVGRLAIAVDYDSIGSGTYTYSDLRDNQYMRDYLVTNQISYNAKDVPLSEGTYRGTSAVIHQRGWYDFNSPPEEGFVALAGEGFGASSAVAYVLLTMKVKMRRRRTINVAREERLPLQADPTLKFAANDFTLKRILNIHKEINSPYNT